MTRNLKIGNTSVCGIGNTSSVCPISGLGRVRNIKFDMNVFDEMLLNAKKCQCYSFYCFWVIKGKSIRVKRKKFKMGFDDDNDNKNWFLL